MYDDKFFFILVFGLDLVCWVVMKCDEYSGDVGSVGGEIVVVEGVF